MAGLKSCMMVFMMMMMMHTSMAQTRHVVGGDLGWTIPPNGAAAYTTWAAGQTFNVGDTLSIRNQALKINQVEMEELQQHQAKIEPLKQEKNRTSLSSCCLTRLHYEIEAAREKIEEIEPSEFLLSPTCNWEKLQRVYNDPWINESATKIFIEQIFLSWKLN